MELINKKEHLSKEGFLKIVSLRASLNKGLSENLQVYFPNIVKNNVPDVFIPKIIDLNWLAGFFSGEGTFRVRLIKSNTHKIEYKVVLVVCVGQHSRDEILIKHLVHLLKCGYAYNYNNRDYVEYFVSKFNDVYYKIIPLFKEYKIQGMKSLDFEDFCKVGELIRNKVHLTTKGLEEIRIIKLRMNKARY